MMLADFGRNKSTVPMRYSMNGIKLFLTILGLFIGAILLLLAGWYLEQLVREWL